MLRTCEPFSNRYPSLHSRKNPPQQNKPHEDPQGPVAYGLFAERIVLPSHSILLLHGVVCSTAAALSSKGQGRWYSRHKTATRRAGEYQPTRRGDCSQIPLHLRGSRPGPRLGA
jgi:hypothetical protein